MVGLHVVDDQIIQCPPVQNPLQLLDVLIEPGALDRVDGGGPLAHYDVGVVGDALGQIPKGLEKMGLVVVDAYPPRVVADRYGSVHGDLLSEVEK